MDSQMVKGKPLTKDETKSLLRLIESSKILMTKTTNATNNRMKKLEWIKLTNRFNATAAICRRTPQQLRLKWENLKKNARKRNIKIKMNRIQNGGVTPEYIPPDDVLDRVTDLLGISAAGLDSSFGGDREIDITVIAGDDGGDGSSGSGMDEGDEQVQEIPVLPPRRHFFAPRTTGKQLKKENCMADTSRIARDLAIAEYYGVKKLCLDAKVQNTLLQNEKLKLENEKLRQELERYRNS